MIDERLVELKKYNFTSNDISKIKENLYDFTRNIIQNESKTISYCEHLLEQLVKRRNQILANLDISKLSHSELIVIIKQLLSIVFLFRI